MRSLPIAVVLLLPALGCALTTANVDLAYIPQAGVAALPEAKDVTVDLHVNDLRLDRSGKVSSKKNGYGMEMAPILANEEVTVTLRRAIEQELQARGFAVGAGAAVAVDADLVRFWNDFKMGFFSGDAVADLQMTVSVKCRGSALYTRSVSVQGTEANTMIASGDNARLALNSALANGMKSLFDDPAFTAALVSGSKQAAP